MVLASGTAFAFAILGLLCLATPVRAGCSFPCAQGQYSYGFFSCQDCERGKYCDNCDDFPCQIGKYQDETKQTSCKDCPNGFYAPSKGQQSCYRWLTCAAGTFVAVEGTTSTSRTCSNCPSNTFAAATDASECTPMTQCFAGTYVKTDGTRSTNRVCAQCSNGTFSTQLNAGACTHCTQCLETQTECTPFTDRVCATPISTSAETTTTRFITTFTTPTTATATTTGFSSSHTTITATATMQSTAPTISATVTTQTTTLANLVTTTATATTAATETRVSTGLLTQSPTVSQPSPSLSRSTTLVIAIVAGAVVAIVLPTLLLCFCFCRSKLCCTSKARLPRISSTQMSTENPLFSSSLVSPTLSAQLTGRRASPSSGTTLPPVPFHAFSVSDDGLCVPNSYDSATDDADILEEGEQDEVMEQYSTDDASKPSSALEVEGYLVPSQLDYAKLNHNPQIPSSQDAPSVYSHAIHTSATPHSISSVYLTANHASVPAPSANPKGEKSVYAGTLPTSEAEGGQQFGLAEYASIPHTDDYYQFVQGEPDGVYSNPDSATFISPQLAPEPPVRSKTTHKKPDTAPPASVYITGLNATTDDDGYEVPVYTAMDDGTYATPAEGRMRFAPASLTTETRLEDEEWYHGGVPRSTAEALLTSTPLPQPGLFLVRDKQLPTTFVLSVLRRNGQCGHHIIRLVPDGTVMLNDAVIPGVATVQDMVQLGMRGGLGRIRATIPFARVSEA
eukprot:m.77592 g.77592  ORF g.77592 m.77592 type:complete len:734 (+) comp12511_c0_seq7:215-2416(+)